MHTHQTYIHVCDDYNCSEPCSQARTFEKPGNEARVFPGPFEKPGNEARVFPGPFEKPGNEARVLTGLFEKPSNEARVLTAMRRMATHKRCYLRDGTTYRIDKASHLTVFLARE